MNGEDEMKCLNCGASIPVEEINKGESVVRCPYCKQTQEIVESDAIKIERIKANKYKDAEIGKRKVEKDAEVAERYIKLEEKKVGLKKTKAFMVFVVLVAIAAVGIWKGNAIIHRNDIKVEQDATAFSQMNYEFAQGIFADYGFTDIQYDEQATLAKKDKKYEYLVTQVSVNGNTTFKAKTWFPKDSSIKITYRTLDPEKAGDVEIPDSSNDLKGQDYVKVCADLKDAGFENITLFPKYDVKFYEGKKNGVIQSVSIEGKDEFYKGEWVPCDAKIRIDYRTKELDYEGEKYKEIQNKLESIGFVDVKCVPLNDLNSSDDKKAGKVKSILINDVEYSNASTLNLFQTVYIRYHSEKRASDSQIKITKASKKFKGEDYQDVVDELEKMGFSNVETVPLGDLKKGIIHKDGHVKEVSIGGKTKFKDGEIFDMDAVVIVSYHSYPNN